MARGATRVSVNQEQDRGAQGRSHNQPALGALGHRPPPYLAITSCESEQALKFRSSPSPGSFS